MNVLCTPPAFILSQEQTLAQIVSQPSPVKTFISSSALALTLLFRVCVGARESTNIIFSRNFREIRTRFACTHLSCCSIVNDQFLATLLRSLNSIPLPIGFVKRFFKTFFIFLKNISQPLVRGGSVTYFITILRACQEVYAYFLLCKFHILFIKKGGRFASPPISCAQTSSSSLISISASTSLLAFSSMCRT